MFLEKQTNDVGCGLRSSTEWGVIFRRRHINENIHIIYNHRSFHTHLGNLKTLLAMKQAFMDMFYLTRGIPSSLRLDENAALARPVQRESGFWYSIVWGTGPSFLYPAHHTRANFASIHPRHQFTIYSTEILQRDTAEARCGSRDVSL